MSDYIKREDAEQIMYSYGIGGTMFVDDFLKPSKSEEARQKEVWESVRKVLNRVAVKDVAPVRHGRNVYMDAKGHCEFKCSLCGADASIVEGGELDGGMFNYCPNCGAKMDEEVD